MYEDEEVKWIDQHLEKGANIWWRIEREKIYNFNEFVQLFTQKYWNNKCQELVQDDLEYSRFKYYEGNNPVQYLEWKVFEYKQLTPAIIRKLLVKKLT